MAEKDALKYVAGYCIVNDVSEREFQMKRSASQWSKGKGCDTFGPIGPYLVTTDEISDPQKLDMWLDVNGVRRQTGNTRTMIFGIAALVADVSRYMTLLPGDVITTGTPPGVGPGHEADAAVPEGRRRRHLGIQGLGEQRQKIVAFKKATARPGTTVIGNDATRGLSRDAFLYPPLAATRTGRLAARRLAHDVLGGVGQSARRAGRLPARRSWRRQLPRPPALLRSCVLPDRRLRPARCRPVDATGRVAR